MSILGFLRRFELRDEQTD